MFGDLFEEDGDGFSSTPGTGKAVKGRECEPPPPRGKVQLCGIKNQGGTCYLNSLIQTLLFTPEFREELFSLGPDELGCLADKDKLEAKVRVIPLELQRLFARLLLVDEQTASTTDLTDSFGWTNNEEMAQQDVQELNRILFSALESSLVGTSGSSLIHRLYHGNLVNQITCKECGNISERQEDFLDLTVSVRGVSGLEEALWNMFVEEELFEGNNLYRCSKCDQLVRAAKSAKLRKLPPFLTISLLRFNFDFAKCERYKETGSYVFPLTFNLRAFCEQSNWSDSEYSYELFSIIIHKGGCYGGHYHVYIKDVDQLGHWEAPEEDVKVKTKTRRQEARVTEVKNENSMDMEDPLSVLIAILAQEESNCVLVDQLGQKLMNKTSTAWSKKYKKQYGPISKFLQNHPEVFLLVSNGTRVALKTAAPVATEPAPTEPISTTSADNSLESTEPEASDTSDGCHWFDLNDSTVTAITEKDIEKQFQGRESAYMLFYRKSTMKRPPDAIGHPAYKVPPHLLEMVQEENARLQQRRAEFDATSNSIEVRLHLAPHYGCENGALHPTAPDNDSIITVTFDRRKTVGDLRLAIYQMQDLWEGDMALTLAKNVPAGLHLYDTLTDDQMSLYSAGVCNGTDLFVWNGREVNGMVVQIGTEWEPVLLTVFRPSAEQLGCEDESGVGEGDTDGSGLVRSMKAFAGGATLGTVLEAFGPQEALLCQEQSCPGADGGGASGWKVFPPQDLQRTLRELSLKDGDALLLLQPEELDSSIFNMNGDIVTVTTPSDCRWLQVEFCPQSGMEEEDAVQDKRKSKVSASGNMLLSEVKDKALEELQLQDKLSGVECCLRQMDRSGKLLPPVHEHLSVRDAGIRLMTSLFLCPGPAPTAQQLFLYFSVGLAPSDGQELEIFVEESLTVKECLKEMLLMARLEGDSWHLRRLDWCEEIGEPLMDENASLKEAKVLHGDTLVLVEGRLPPKGYLKLSVRMYMDPFDSSSFPELNQESRSNMLHTESSGSEMRFVGYAEISDEASLDDLKTQVTTLPALQDVCVPSPAFLRVWMLEGRKLARILRGKQQTLRKLKLGNGAEVCVQRLMKEEDLGLKDLLLKVQMGVPREKAYYPAEEFLWDAGRDGTARGLYAALAAQYGLTPDNLLLAKHLPDKHTWMPISNWTQQVSKRKKKRKAEGLQAAPFYLKDGDIIGVKNLLIDTNKEFSTLQDEIGQQRLREETANHKTGGNAASGDCAQNTGPKKSGSTKNRKPEVALSINVGEFR